MPETTAPPRVQDGRLQLRVVEADGYGEVQMLTRAGGELGLHPLAAGLRSVEDQSRRARPCRDGQLQVADIHVERGYIERRATAEQRGLPPDLVVPRLLVLPSGVAAVRGEVLRRAQRHVERIVDPTQPESPRDLSVQRERVGRL